MNNSELLDFTGGMNTVIASHLMPINESIELTNVDIRFGSLKSITNLENTSSAQGAYFIEYRRKLLFYDAWRSNALIDDKLYWSDGLNTGKVLPDGRELPLGIASPTQSVTQEPAGVVSEGVHKGEFKYTYTFYSTDTDIESAPAKLPSYIELDEQNTRLLDFEDLPTQANKYRVYRIGGYLTRFTLVATIDKGDLPYIDDIDDTEVDGRLLHTLRTGVPPAGIENFTELNGRLFGSQGSKVYFSGLGAPDSWYSDDFFNFPDIITGLAKVPAGLLVMGRTFVYLISGTSPSNFSTRVISDYLGCINNRSIAHYTDRVIFLGVDGILASDGFSIQNLTYRKIQEISDMYVNSAAVVNDVYYITFKPFMVPSDELLPSDDVFPGGIRGAGNTTENEAQGLIALDFKRGNIFSYHYLNYLNASSIGIYKGTLYMVLNGDREPILCAERFDCSKPFCYGEYILAKLGGHLAATYKHLRYLSPQLIDNSYSTLKEYDKVRINFIGEFKVTVIFSNLEIAITETIKSARNITNDLELLREHDSVAIIGIPNQANKSYSIQFYIEGTGIVKSIQYSWKNRELP